MSGNAGGTPAGWYEDGQTAGHERFWDGVQWTDQFRPLPSAAPPPAYPPAYPPVAGAAPAQGYPPYQPVQPGAPGAPGAKRGLSAGGVIGIVIAAVVVVVAVVLILGFTVFKWGGGGGVSSAQQQEFLQSVKSGASGVGVDLGSYTDAQILEAGNKICEVGRGIDPNNPLAATGSLLQLATSVDPTLLAVAGASLDKLCPDVISKFKSIGENFGE